MAEVVSGGSEFTCPVVAGSCARCFGRGGDGELGTGTRTAATPFLRVRRVTPAGWVGNADSAISIALSRSSGTGLKLLIVSGAAGEPEALRCVAGVGGAGILPLADASASRMAWVVAGEREIMLNDIVFM